MKQMHIWLDKERIVLPLPPQTSDKSPSSTGWFQLYYCSPFDRLSRCGSRHLSSRHLLDSPRGSWVGRGSTAPAQAPALRSMTLVVGNV